MAQQNLSTQLPLDQIFANTERSLSHNSSPATDTALATKFLSRFGLQNSGDVTSFFQSTGGQVVLGLIAQELMVEKVSIETLIAALQQIELQKQIQIGLLISAFLDQEDELREIETIRQSEQDAKRLLDNKKLVNNSSASLQQIKYYTDTLQVVESIKAAKVQTLQEFETKIDSLDRQIAGLQQQHQVDIQSIDDIHGEFESYIESGHASPSPDYIKSLEQRIAEHTKQVGLAEDDAVGVHDVSAEPRHHIKLQTLAEILQVLKGHAYYSDHHGNLTKKASSAAYMVPMDKVITIITNGQGEKEYYLTPRGLNLSSLTPEHKAQCKEDFLKLTPTTKNGLQQEIERKINPLHIQKETFVAQCKKIGNEIHCLESQEDKLRAQLKAKGYNTILFAKERLSALREENTKNNEGTSYSSPTPLPTNPIPKPQK